MDHPHSEMLEGHAPEKAERPKKKRRKRQNTIEVELDPSGGFHWDMLRSSLEDGELSLLVVLDKFKQQEDVKMYIHLPDYDDFQGYDLGMVRTLNRVGRRIYANFHKPSWGTLKHHLLSAETP